MNNSLKILESAIKNKEQFIVNYGDGIKEIAYFDKEKKFSRTLL